MLYFLVENGNLNLRQFAADAAEYYANESEDHAGQNITSTKVTAIVSIVVIAVISLVITPILTKAEVRKYKALVYFLKIPKDKLTEMITNCEYCINMNDEKRYRQIQKDYEQYLQVKLVDQQVEQLRQAQNQRNNMDFQNNLSSNNKSSNVTGTH